jgi:hypothetical protein
VRAARVQMAPLDKPRPEALNKLAGGAENDPKNYRFLSNEWTGLITVRENATSGLLNRPSVSHHKLGC